METKFLETFLAVVKAGSIAGAARVLNVAPTTISQQIKALEKTVGCALLARTGHTVKATSAGHRILERARHIVRDTQDLCTIARTDHLPSGPLLLGAAHSALMRLVPAALKSWNNLYPDIGIFIHPGDSVPLFHQVVDGEIDAAIIGDPVFKIPKTCDWHVLREEELVLITPSDMVVSNPLETLKNSPFIRFDRSYAVGRLVEHFLQHHGISPHAQFELDGIEVITRFVREGLGVAILPRDPLALNLDSRIKYWPLPAPALSRRVGFMLARSSVRAPLAKALLALLKTVEP